MHRKIIKIDEALCNGCGNCVSGCSEGALKIVDGKAKLVREDFCDGFGDCVGECPTGALTIEEREAAAFDEVSTIQSLKKAGGDAAVQRMLVAQHKHRQKSENGGQVMSDHSHHDHAGCPGSRMQFNPENRVCAKADVKAAPGIVNKSDLNQWPVQLHLVNAAAPCFENAELVVLSTCSPIASADIHWRFIRGRAVVVACPKLDDTSGYAEKLAAIFKTAKTPKVLTVIMQVPCCHGLSEIVREAVELSARSDLVVEEYVVGLNGAIS